ncbi:Glycosyl hydrolases family 16 [Geosmithia morbida]|uniref:Crh-like protein n=1 Tax=Geosmithia morbida TaxID=1094350 RepID=A0A9P4YUS7_9HYPO|nr:Glycosyl hydrolases family 16 [Geosmithia morbida]KAF4122169.1 Glycosyl hydrolases family 16 [Geosmithia morbida]
MLSRGLTSVAVALAASGLVAAQTFTDCNPLEKTCDPDPALGNQKGECDWTDGDCDLFEALPGTTISYDDKGALFSISKESEAPTIATHKRIFFGKVEVEMQAAQGQGIITSVVLESKDLDEIDWEWIGGDNTKVQSNYYGKGDTTTYDRVVYHDISAPLTSVHKYTVEWTSSAITWSVDDNVLRTLKYADAQGGSRYPQTPMEVKLGTWVGGGKNTNEGTVEWAGGYTDFSEAPFNAWYKSISITDYAGGDSATKDSIKEYVWSDKTGSFESIKVIKGTSTDDDGDDDDNDDDNDDTTTSSGKATATSSSNSSKTSDSSDATSTSDGDDKSTTASSSASTTVATPSASSGSSDSGNSTTTPTSTSSDSSATGSDVPEAAAAGLFASLGRVALAGVAAVVIAQAI